MLKACKSQLKRPTGSISTQDLHLKRFDRSLSAPLAIPLEARKEKQK